MSIQTVVFKSLLGIVGIFGCAVSAVGTEYQHTLKAGNMDFSWSLQGENLAVRIAAPTTGWVGIGFNPERRMKGADFIIGYVREGRVTLLDEVGTSPVQHQADTARGGKNTVTVVGGTEEKNVTTLEFTIPLASGDTTDTQLKPEGDTVVLLAYGPNGNDSFKPRHTFRTQKTVNLATGVVR